MQINRAALLLALGLLLVLQVLARPLLPIDETRYLSVAWEMHLSGDPFHLTRNFEPYTHKPPLLFWLINLVWMVTGVSEFAARLVGPACALAAVAGTGWLGARLWPRDRAIGTYAMVVLAGFSLFLIYGGTTMFDAMLSLAVLAGIAVIWRVGHGEAGVRVWLWFGVVLALGVYAKGPVILVHLLPPLLMIRFWAPRPPGWFEIARGLGMAVLVALGLVAIWLVPALLAGDPAFREELLWTQSAGRVAGGMAHDRPVWFLLVLLPVLLFPWVWSWRLMRVLPSVSVADAAGRLCLIWAVSGLVLFSLISGKQVHYLIPEFPAVALLIARALSGATAGMNRRGGSGAPIVFVVLGGLALVFAAGFIPADDVLAELAPRWTVALFGVVCLLLAALGLRLPLLSANLAMGAGLSAGLHLLVVLTALGAYYDARPMAALLAKAEQGGLALSGMGYHAEFNFAARLTEKVATPDTVEALMAWAEAHPEGTVFGPAAGAAIAAPPGQILHYAGRTYGVWPASGVTFQELARGD